jgi:hypothetical protein
VEFTKTQLQAMLAQAIGNTVQPTKTWLNSPLYGGIGRASERHRPTSTLDAPPLNALARLLRWSRLLFVTDITIDGVRPHTHWACMLCLLRLTASERPPPFRLAEPLQALCGFILRALQAQQLHFAAI